MVLHKKILIGVSSAVVLFCGAVRAEAAYIYFEPASVSKAVGESFTVNIRLNTEGESINAVDITLSYPPLIRATAASKAGSAIQLWVEDPGYTGSAVTLTGGVPGGLQNSGALLAKITFEARSVGDGALSLGGGSSVLLNDGKGTKAQLRLSSNVIHVTARSGGKSPTPTPKSETGSTPVPSEEPAGDDSDSIRPNKFSISVGKDARVFGGKYFVSFFTTDEKSGVSYYEVKEGDGPYKIARTPYLLSDQKLRSVVRVRAYDSAGNFRESIHPGPIRRIFLWIINLF